MTNGLSRNRRMFAAVVSGSSGGAEVWNAYASGSPSASQPGPCSSVSGSRDTTGPVSLRSCCMGQPCHARTRAYCEDRPMTTTREIHLASRPTGWPTVDNFRLVEAELPEPGPGQVVVQNTVMSVDPYMRGRMNDVRSYVPPYALDAPLDGGAVGEVVASRADTLNVGDAVLHGLGWR